MKTNLIDKDGWISLENAFPTKPGLYKVKVSVGAFKEQCYEDEEQLSIGSHGEFLGFCKKRGDWHSVSHWKPFQEY